jgi:hypothetical protein
MSVQTSFDPLQAFFPSTGQQGCLFWPQGLQTLSIQPRPMLQLETPLFTQHASPSRPHGRQSVFEELQAPSQSFRVSAQPPPLHA